MYSIVLATMLTAGSATPQFCFFSHCHGCWSSCHGCSGCYSCHGCWSACYGCYGCYSCHGCWSSCYNCFGCWDSCYGCYGCHGCWSSCYSCYGCWDSCYSCYGCWGYCYGCYGCWGGCHGCYASVVPVQQAPPREKLPKPSEEKTGRVSGPATVIVKAPLDVNITVNGQATKRTQAEQTFATPTLEAGRRYAYTFHAEAVRNGKTVSINRKVTVWAGQRTEVDFNDLLHGQSREAARVTVRVPRDARLFVDGVSYPSGSRERSFHTPPLQAGKNYFYTIRAEVEREGQTVRKSKRVTVAAGKQVTVSFDTLSSVQTASR
jgi:uncharacterized protein (TIGR03000 family)